MQGDCLARMKELEDNSVDSVVTDPPYGISFMNKSWDHRVPSVEIWKECLRVLKPGGYLLSFAGTRTQHRMACNIEDAGFEIRDMIAWVYAQGMPKHKSCLKPALEPITLARKPAKKATLLNIDDCRVEFLSEEDKASAKPQGKATYKSGNLAGKAQDGYVIVGPKVDGEVLYWCQSDDFTGWGARETATVFYEDGIDPVESTGREPATKRKEFQVKQGTGRYPSNVIHDGSEEVVDLFPNSNGAGGSLPQVKITGYGDGIGTGKSEYIGGERIPFESGSGSAARFFYCAKTTKKDRGEGNRHPTVKPTELMRYLCRLVTPKGGTVLDPFFGSGSTGKAAILEGFNFVGIEIDGGYFRICKERILKNY